MERIPTPRELAEEARRALAANPMTSRERWEFLIQQGIIDSEGRVICNRLFGEAPADQTMTQASETPSGNGTAEKPASPQTDKVP